LFCRLAREFFAGSGAYFWSRTSEGELTGAEADGNQADHFRGRQLRAGDSAVALEAVQSRRTIFRNRIDPQRYPLVAEFRAQAIMSAPLLVFNEVIGAIAFLRDAPDAQFVEDDAAKATILAGQLGTALEALRLKQLSGEEHRRAMILAEVANSLNGMPDTSSVMESLADRLRVLLRSPVVVIFVQAGDCFQMQAAAADTPALARAIRALHEEKKLRSAAEIAARAVAAGERITVAVDSASHFGEDLPSGVLIAAPFRASRSHGVILVYPRQSPPFSEDDRQCRVVWHGAGPGAGTARDPRNLL